jgi:hypothetical protein
MTLVANSPAIPSGLQDDPFVGIGPEGPTVRDRTVAYFLHYRGAGPQAAVECLKVRFRVLQFMLFDVGPDLAHDLAAVRVPLRLAQHWPGEGVSVSRVQLGMFVGQDAHPFIRK